MGSQRSYNKFPQCLLDSCPLSTYFPTLLMNSKAEIEVSSTLFSLAYVTHRFLPTAIRVSLYFLIMTQNAAALPHKAACHSLDSLLSGLVGALRMGSFSASAI